MHRKLALQRSAATASSGLVTVQLFQDMSVCEFYAGCLCTPRHATRDVELVHVPLHVGCVLQCSAFLRPLPEFDAKCGSGLWEKVGMTRLTIDIERQSAWFCLDL